MKVNSLIFGGALFKLDELCKSVTLPLRLACLSGAILVYGDEQDKVFEESQQEDSDKKIHTD